MEQIAIFCDTDDFCKAYEEYCRNKLLMDILHRCSGNSPHDYIIMFEIRTAVARDVLGGHSEDTSLTDRTGHISVGENNIVDIVGVIVSVVSKQDSVPNSV